MVFLYRFFCGVLEVEFFGIYPEKVLNICSKRGINIWSARYVKQRIRCKITVRDFLKLPQILRRSGVRVHIISKTGFPFFIKRYNKRFGILAGVILFFAILYTMSGYIWVIEIEGVKTVSEQEILQLCDELGVRKGVRASSIESKEQAQELLLKSDKLAWASFNVEGCCLTVNVTEIVQKQEDNTVFSNIVANEDGIITHIDVTSGNCIVKVGDVVKRGDVLVSGIIENTHGTKFVHSIGRIKAHCETEICLEQPFKTVQKYPTGEIEEKSVLELFGLKIPLYVGSETGDYSATLQKKQATLFSRELPIAIYTKRFKFYKKVGVTLSEEKAREILDKKFQKQYEGKIKSKEFRVDSNGVTLRAIITAEKEISVNEPLKIK